MNGGIRARLLAIRSSYWFVPSVMALLAILLGAGMIWIDVRLGSGWIKGISWYQQIRADGAREMLSTIAGSMITVAGVVFSITIVALAYSSSQYGPRVLTNFMGDRGNKVTLGTFIATFLYSLMVLRTIRSGDDGFVPQYAVVVAMLLAACSIGVLIYFIHHVPQSIHINHVVARIGEQLVDDTRRRFPTQLGTPAEAPRPDRRLALEGDLIRVPGEATGYIQNIDHDRLLGVAREADVLIRLRYRPGDFIMAGRSLAVVGGDGDWDEGCTQALQACFTVGRKRTPEDDLMFLVSELVEIAARALSPGVNDPMTAVTCLDWLGAGALEFAARKLPESVREDEDGTPRLIARPDDFRLFVADSLGRLRHYVARDPIASLHFLRVVGEVAAGCPLQDQIDLLSAEAARFTEVAAAQLDGADARAVEERARELQSILARGAGRIDSAQAEWLGGSA
ncbi:DUF2254 domain-containing protein [Sphingosinicella rhizophila]|uniref:DUF2254 domain-containing protein n=1 Tax=Sphingosinicella rhizophila TaxID=3050082 RepID=A0ABU3Q767_9SPHN|nr:DUF2254 domain-containing protein [Sphingosinicella sp. GR2756]MDT9599147.1 DUF2254 domain-containing protein [Sphingosinicella sp. GR2756]